MWTYSIIMWTVFDLTSTVNSAITVESEGYITEEKFHFKLHGYTVHQTMLKPFYYQLMHIMLKNTELLKHSKITLQPVSVYVETIFRELQSVLG